MNDKNDKPLSGEGRERKGDEFLKDLMSELHYALDMGGKLSLPIQIQMKKVDAYLNGQTAVTARNLQFYARMANEFDWHTDIIHKGVIIQTLNEIAERLRVGGSPARSVDLEAIRNAVSKLESQVCRNSDLPPVYKEIVKNAFAAIERLERPARSVEARDFEKFWASTNNSNYFSVRQITVETLKQVAKESWLAAFPGSLPSEETRYLKLLRWFKLFYGFFQEDVKGKPSACASALSEVGELQEFVREANTIK